MYNVVSTYATSEYTTVPVPVQPPYNPSYDEYTVLVRIFPATLSTLPEGPTLRMLNLRGRPRHTYTARFRDEVERHNQIHRTPCRRRIRVQYI